MIDKIVDALLIDNGINKDSVKDLNTNNEQFFSDVEKAVKIAFKRAVSEASNQKEARQLISIVENNANYCAMLEVIYNINKDAQSKNIVIEEEINSIEKKCKFKILKTQLSVLTCIASVLLVAYIAYSAVASSGIIPIPLSGICIIMLLMNGIAYSKSNRQLNTSKDILKFIQEAKKEIQNFNL